MPHDTRSQNKTAKSEPGGESYLEPGPRPIQPFLPRFRTLPGVRIVFQPPHRTRPTNKISTSIKINFPITSPFCHRNCSGALAVRVGTVRDTVQFHQPNRVINWPTGRSSTHAHTMAVRRALCPALDCPPPLCARIVVQHQSRLRLASRAREINRSCPADSREEVVGSAARAELGRGRRARGHQMRGA